MKRILLAAVALSLLLCALALSGNQKPAAGDLEIQIGKRNPWTNLDLNNKPDTFHFVVVSDRTGGHRARVFSQAVEQINMLQPAFVISVGDLIEGYTKEPGILAGQWKDLQSYSQKLQMPFFYVPGNHDLSNPVETAEWETRFGRRYYHFVFKDVLFLMLCSDDPFEGRGGGRFSKEQIAWATQVLKDNPKVRWTIVALHKPVWAGKNVEQSGWLEIEKALAGRPYTVFAGHVHRYQKFVRQGMNYYQLATTGGDSKMRGLAYGEFDHIVWVTMKKDGPVLANLLLDGIYPENLQRPVTAEDGSIRFNRLPTQPVKGTLFVEGAPVAGAKVTFQNSEKGSRNAGVSGDAFTEADGSFTITTYEANDGLPTGEYAVTAVLRQRWFDAAGTPGPNRLPEKYASPKTTDLKVQVKTGANNFSLNLAK